MALTQSARRRLKEAGKRGGQIGGKSRSARKLKTARENGKLGGRPRKSDDGAGR